MAEGNGQQDSLSRLDRIERAMELLIGDHEDFRVEHEAFRAEHKMLLRAQVLHQGAMDDLRETVKELSSKIDFVIDGIDRDHREVHERIKRLEEKQ